MILRAAVLSGFLLLAGIAFAQHPHENGSPQPPPPPPPPPASQHAAPSAPPPTATPSPNPSPSPITPHSTSSGISPTTGPFSPPAHRWRSQSPSAEAGTPAGAGPKHCKREPCTQPPPTDPVGGNAQPARPWAAAAPAQPCPRGQTPQGSGCVPAIVGQCQPGQVWNGMACDQPGDKCTTFRSRAETIRTEAFGVSSQMKTACMKNPNGKACTELTQEHDMIVLRYRSLLNEAPAACRATLPDPLTL